MHEKPVGERETTARTLPRPRLELYDELDSKIIHVPVQFGGVNVTMRMLATPRRDAVVKVELTSGNLDALYELASEDLPEPPQRLEYMQAPQDILDRYSQVKWRANRGSLFVEYYDGSIWKMKFANLCLRMTLPC